MSRFEKQKRSDTRTWVRLLERWFLKHHRKLPWRETTDPYSIWISEVMLQQTQVATVLPYYARFMARWPTLHALANAAEEDVLSTWSGLGYYSRARNLRKGAQYLSEVHEGSFPRDPLVLRKTPGIGPYTAGAILSIAYDDPVPLVDGNVQRVFARFYGERAAIETPEAQTRFWNWASAWVNESRSPRVLNQALMELGAIVCSKAAPQCARCPLQKGCFAFATDLQAEFPKRKQRRSVKELWWIGAVFERGNRLWLKQNGVGDWWQDLWDFPILPIDNPEGIATVAPRLLDAHFPGVKQWVPLAPQKHTVTHHRIHLFPYVAKVSNRFAAPAASTSKWWPIADLEHAPISSLTKKVMRAYY